MKPFDTAKILAACLLLTMTTLAGCGSANEASDSGEAPEKVPEPIVMEVETGSTDDIGWEKARDIALSKVPGATEADVYEMEQEYDDGRLEYEGSIYYNGYEYEFEIDGATGNILQWEIDD